MKLVKTSLLIFAVMSFLFGIVYPLTMTGLARLAFPRGSAGSLVTTGGRVVGSELIGQKFTSPRYFHGRPSFVKYDASGSGASNYGPTNKKLIDDAAKAADAVRRENNLPAGAAVPTDLALNSGSGLDPHINLDGALVQIARVARERKLNVTEVSALVKRHSERRYMFFGEEFVNVLRLNLALDENVGKLR